MKVRLKKTNRIAATPRKAHPSDLCYDCVAVSEEQVAPNVWKYRLGIALQIERSREIMIATPTCHGGRVSEHYTMMDFSRSPLNLSIDLRPRSSVWETGMVLSCCEGTIDENYTGEISAVFYHIMTDMPRYKVGDKIGQIKLGVAIPMEFEEVAELEETDRGANGYGSTGK